VAAAGDVAIRPWQHVVLSTRKQCVWQSLKSGADARLSASGRRTTDAVPVVHKLPSLDTARVSPAPQRASASCRN
jgi:hypothetical protein